MLAISTENKQVTFRQGHLMTLTSQISKVLNLIVLPYQRTQNHQKKSLLSFFHSKALGNKFDIAIKKVKVNPGTSLIKN